MLPSSPVVPSTHSYQTTQLFHFDISLHQSINSTNMFGTTADRLHAYAAVEELPISDIKVQEDYGFAKLSTVADWKRLIGLYGAMFRCGPIKPAHLHIWHETGTLAENIMLEFEVPGQALKKRAAIPLGELELNGKQNRDDWFDNSQPSKNPDVCSWLSKNDEYLWLTKTQHILCRRGSRTMVHKFIVHTLATRSLTTCSLLGKPGRRSRLKVEYHYGLDKVLADKINMHLDKIEAEDAKNAIEAEKESETTYM